MNISANLTQTNQVPGGRLAEVYSGKWVFFIAVLLNVIGTLLSPISAVNGSAYLIMMRIIEGTSALLLCRLLTILYKSHHFIGLGGGVTFPSMNVLIAAWAPIAEWSVITSVIYGGLFH